MYVHPHEGVLLVTRLIRLWAVATTTNAGKHLCGTTVANALGAVMRSAVIKGKHRRAFNCTQRSARRLPNTIEQSRRTQQRDYLNCSERRVCAALAYLPRPWPMWPNYFVPQLVRCHFDCQINFNWKMYAISNISTFRWKVIAWSRRS